VNEMRRANGLNGTVGVSWYRPAGVIVGVDGSAWIAGWH
jgi:hypothetical protein